MLVCVFSITSARILKRRYLGPENACSLLYKGAKGFYVCAGAVLVSFVLLVVSFVEIL